MGGGVRVRVRVQVHFFVGGGGGSGSSSGSGSGPGEGGRGVRSSGSGSAKVPYVNMVFFPFFFANKNVLKYLFYSVFEHQPKFGKKWPKKTTTFHILQHRLIKNKFCCNPPFFKNWFFLSF